MNPRDLFEAIGEVDAGLLIRSERTVPSGSISMRWVALAASLLLILGVSTLFVAPGLMGRPMPPETTQTDETTRAPFDAAFAVTETADGGYLLTAYHGAGGEVRIPFGITEIGPGVFRQDEDNPVLVTELAIPDSVTKIHDYAFYGCYTPEGGLREVDMSAQIREIGAHAFENCLFLERVICLRSPDAGAVTLGEGAFAGCPRLIRCDVYPAAEAAEAELPGRGMITRTLHFPHDDGAGGRAEAVLSLLLPDDWTITYPTDDYRLLPFARSAQLWDGDDVVGTVGFLPYTVPEGAEEIPSAIFSQLRSQIFIWNVGLQFERVGQNDAWCTALTSVTYAGRYLDDGPDRTNSAIVSYHPGWQMYIALELCDGTQARTICAQEELERIAGSIAWLADRPIALSAADECVSVLVDASDERGGYDDASGRYGMLDYTLRLPRMSVHQNLYNSRNLYDEINAEISELFLMPALAGIGALNAAFDVGCDVRLHDNILSLVIVRHVGFSTSGMTVWCVNVDLDAQTRLTLDEFAAHFGQTAAELTAGLEHPDDSLFFLDRNGRPVVIDRPPATGDAAADGERSYVAVTEAGTHVQIFDTNPANLP